MPVLILIYHSVLADDDKAGNAHSAPYREFVEQMRILDERGVAIIRWRELAGRAAHRDLQVGVTFDDANSSDLACAKLLAAAGHEALFFIPTAYLGQPGHLADDEVREMHGLGMTIGSHSHSHDALTALCDDDLHDELRTSKRILETLLGTSIEHLSFPGGDYDARVIAAARAAGYRFLHTSDWGVNGAADVAAGRIRRVPILGGYSRRQFADLVSMRRYALLRAQFHVKQMAKRLLGPRYVRLRDLLLKRGLRSLA
jgi:peptidoglycan/xylan/chitin deacetylase (PgdA/CDA1 family)